MIINNAINSPLPTSLALGGTNAALTASNGGIFYSTASAGAILSGTATANQILLSGSSSAPAWSTATYPATTTASQLLYSSAANVIGGLATENSACLVSDNITFPVVIPYPVWSLPMQDGQIVIGGTSGRPEPATLTGGIGGTRVTNSSGSITIDTGVPSWVWIGTQTASNNNALSFNNEFNSYYIAYRIVVKNILPTSNGINLWLRFGTGLGSYVSTGLKYTYQQCTISAAGVDNFYHGYNGAGFDEAILTLTNIHGISSDPTYGGICGIIDLFVTSGSSHVANGIARLGYQVSDGITQYVNTTSTFQITANNYTSVQLLLSSINNMVSGSATLYGLTTLE